MRYIKKFENYLNNIENFEEDDEDEEDDEIFSSSDELNQFAYLLKNAGFKLIVPENPTTWLYYSQYDKIGQVSINRGEFSFSSVHKPSREFGTGYNIIKTYEPTIELAIEAMNTLKIGWDRTHGLPIKYRSAEDFITNGHNKMFNYSIF